MQATTRSIVLQPGEALAPGGRASDRLFVTEGKVLVQAPAQWLGGTVVFPPARRVAAPAALACNEIASLTALAWAKVQVEEAASPFARLHSAWRQWRPAWSAGPLLSRE
jgi:hypothetical protein